MRRALLVPILEDLKRKMVFLSGPRQVGKTTLARQVLEAASPHDPVYLNWDRPEHRKTIRELSWSLASPVAVLDEVHKYPRWKNLIKGFHDTEGHRQRLLVTGSARLDLYRRGGDSMVGRYMGFRLHPLSFGELARRGELPDAGYLRSPERWSDAPPSDPGVEKDLISLGGFPEPFLEGSERAARRWRLARREHVLGEDLRDLTRVREVALVGQLTDLLVERVSGPLSLNVLRGGLETHHATVSSWVEVLERLYVIFRVRPFSGSLVRTLRKESKAYFWDWSEVPSPGPRFENFVASHLLKYCHWMQDLEGERVELRYVRDREKHEVDFLLLKDRKPWVLVEVKLSDREPSPSLAYFRERLKAPFAFQVIGGVKGGGEGVVPASRFFAGLP